MPRRQSTAISPHIENSANVYSGPRPRAGAREGRYSLPQAAESGDAMPEKGISRISIVRGSARRKTMPSSAAHWQQIRLTNSLNENLDLIYALCNGVNRDITKAAPW